MILFKPRTIFPFFSPVDCAPGTYFDPGFETCELCAIGTYQNELGQLRSKSCPAIVGRPGVTERPGARTTAPCTERGLDGHAYDDSTSLCRPCGYGKYQTNEGMFQLHSEQSNRVSLKIPEDGLLVTWLVHQVCTSSGVITNNNEAFFKDYTLICSCNRRLTVWSLPFS